MHNLEINLASGDNLLIKIVPNLYGAYASKEESNAFINDLQKLLPPTTKVILTTMCIDSIAIIKA